MGIAKSIKNYFINKRISTCKYVHIMFNDKFNKPFVDFLNKNFDEKEHVVLCKRWFQEHPFPTGKNVIEISTLEGISFKNNAKVICHSLFDEDLVNYLYNHQNILKQKTYWVIWGGDLYEAPRDEKNDYVRKNFKGYCSVIDKEYASSKYGLTAPFYNVHYPFATTIFSNHISTPKRDPKQATRIQVNNSCDQSTLEALEFLKKFKNENIIVTTIVSYGNMQYKAEIIKTGVKYFGHKFEYLDKFLNSNDYKNFVSKNDILILNQNRQQGVGNLIMYIQQGKKVFVRRDISTFKYLNEVEHVKIFDTLEIPSLSFETFLKNDYVEQNKENIKNWTNENSLISLWRNFFNAEENSYFTV